METKVDVTTNDGTRYRVRFNETNVYGLRYVLTVDVYVKRRKFPGYRHVDEWRFISGKGVYDCANPNFVRIARDCVFIAHDRVVDRRPGVAALRKWSGKVDV
ncbi:hypothetical protein MHB77_32560 [Paenibacillus sp. FSL K6-3166]|uniref:hypothetical protein n=1 Tax=unclassified Paenibacillus TaxID=185978 RepID=UPI000B9FF730|nr:hypothetical protein [Paenibacillus sp. VTT E-133291]OZQ84670.1 hypothetical protein CA598_23025 [Paenibacillus sp. VTT E-133291]